MKRTSALDDADLTRAFQQAQAGEKFLVSNEPERKRAYRAASSAGRKIATRRVRDGGFHATVL